MSGGSIIGLYMEDMDDYDLLEFFDIDYTYNNNELIIFIHDLVDACSDKEIYLRLMILCKIKRLNIKMVYLNLSNSNNELYKALFKCIRWNYNDKTAINISDDRVNDKVKVRKKNGELNKYGR